MRRLGLWLSSLLVLCSACLGEETGREILRQALDLHRGVQDYTADVVVVMDLPNLQVPRRTAKVYFKRPNKVAIKSRGIVMIPKRALMPGNLGTEITQDTRVDIIGRATVGGHPVTCLRLTDPKAGPETETLLVWVRTDRYTVEAMEIHERQRKTLSVAWAHQLIGGRYWMPERIVARIYNWRTGDGKTSEGTVTVDFSNMQVNTDLSDKVFEELKR